MNTWLRNGENVLRLSSELQEINICVQLEGATLPYQGHAIYSPTIISN